MPRPGASPLARFGGRLRFAARGAALVYRDSGNARIETALAYLAVSATLAEGGGTRAGLIVSACAAVLAAEAMNTAVEKAVDRIGRDRHPLSAAAKDAAAGAVLIVAAGAAALSVLVLGPHVADTWQAFARASWPARIAWLAGLAVVAAGAVRPEGRPAPQGSGPDRRT